MATQLLVVNSVKKYAGYWRPYFLNECAYNATLGVCTSEDFDDAYRSFPSGHAASSVAPLLHTSLRLLGALRVGYVPYRVRLGASTYVEFDGVLTLICMLPTLLAIFISASRVHDDA
eukprot:CAMPEP_0119067568 /NCGR_PEP_ID=MMETSP1178-20130426/9939_1 /TAXON_ID=33656 /ORGANISM="unid sp, Strain CCMP2000" /LENGTH=116 /DNA_ID=CAMNT_0007049237 /DNA_START=42 /DNA_END=388 /DNA_ORIENTATION=-